MARQSWPPFLSPSPPPRFLSFSFLSLSFIIQIKAKSEEITQLAHEAQKKNISTDEFERTINNVKVLINDNKKVNKIVNYSIYKKLESVKAMIPNKVEFENFNECIGTFGVETKTNSEG